MLTLLSVENVRKMKFVPAKIGSSGFVKKRTPKEEASIKMYELILP